MEKTGLSVCSDAVVTWNTLSPWLPRSLLSASTQRIKEGHWTPSETELELKFLHKALFVVKNKICELKVQSSHTCTMTIVCLCLSSNFTLKYLLPLGLRSNVTLP